MAKKEFDFDAALSDIFAEQPELPDKVKVKDIKEVPSEPEIDPIVEAKKKEEEEAKRKAEAERKKKEEETAKKKAKSEAERKKAVEEAKKKAEEQALRERQELEATKRKRKEQEAEKKKQKEEAEKAERKRIEAERKRRETEKALKKRMTMIYAVCALLGLVSFVSFFLVAGFDGWYLILFGLMVLVFVLFGAFAVINGSFSIDEDDKDPKWKTMVYRSVFALLLLFLSYRYISSGQTFRIDVFLSVVCGSSFGGTGIVALLLNIKKYSK